VFRADAGGFDAGSQFPSNVLGAYSFTFAVRNGVTYAGLLGYRALSMDFEKRLRPQQMRIRCGAAWAGLGIDYGASNGHAFLASISAILDGHLLVDTVAYQADLHQLWLQFVQAGLVTPLRATIKSRHARRDNEEARRHWLEIPHEAAVMHVCMS